ncbi:hypothetical protein GCM10023149_10910 [Mucilaginibacter gynuensis]|uniref:Uncharacterized protein n=1 Tax=Mucilaginibacter gynuensis TaxID=1302236 RepID=A0ABP8G094_9SPHI
MAQFYNTNLYTVKGGLYPGLCVKERLRRRLTELFNRNYITQYIDMAAQDALPNACEMQLTTNILPDEDDGSVDFARLKLALEIWKGMNAEDRCAILQQFQTLFANRVSEASARGSIMTFCKVFICELSFVLLEGDAALN